MKMYVRLTLFCLSVFIFFEEIVALAVCKCDGPNEVYRSCGTRCPPTCQDRNPVCTKECFSGCFCKGDRVRHNGTCIPVKNCPDVLECEENEQISDCPYPCPPERSCDQEFQGYEYSCIYPPPDFVCNPKCVCMPGFIRNNQNKCVQLENCCEDPNAEVVDCPKPCPETCDAPSGSDCGLECTRKGCQCKFGFILHEGRCIQYDECPNQLCTGPNEVYHSCKNPCPPTCITISSLEPQPMCMPPFPCPGGCDCLPGYVRDENNICILPSECNITCTGVNQILNPCPPQCSIVEDCGSYMSGIAIMCASDSTGVQCSPKCECTEGNILVFGECKNPNECCFDPNASVVECPSNCPRTCENLLKTDIQCEQFCQFRGCQCNEGYVKDSRSLCIKPEECPPIQCPPNEHYNNCPRYCTFDPDCPSYVDGIIRDCAAPPDFELPCQPRCECDEGFLRINGTCLPPDSCCPGPNEEVVNCPDPCPKSCANQHTHGNRPCPRLCLSRGCQCKKGFVRDANNICVHPGHCPPTTTPVIII